MSLHRIGSSVITAQWMLVRFWFQLHKHKQQQHQGSCSFLEQFALHHLLSPITDRYMRVLSFDYQTDDGVPSI